MTEGSLARIIDHDFRKSLVNFKNSKDVPRCGAYAAKKRRPLEMLIKITYFTRTIERLHFTEKESIIKST